MNGTNTKTNEGVRHGKGDVGMGVLSRVTCERELSESGLIETEYVVNGARMPSVVTWDGELRGRGSKECAEGVRTCSEPQEKEKRQTSKSRVRSLWEYLQNGGQKMNVWANWLRPAPSYFDRITGIVEQLVELECDMRDGENAAHDTLHEIEAARREISVRIRRA